MKRNMMTFKQSIIAWILILVSSACQTQEFKTEEERPLEQVGEDGHCKRGKGEASGSTEQINQFSQRKDVRDAVLLESIGDQIIELPCPKGQKINQAFATFKLDIEQMKKRYPEFTKVFGEIDQGGAYAKDRLKQDEDLQHDARNFFETVLWKYIRASKQELGVDDALLKQLSQQVAAREEMFNEICYSFQTLMVNVSRAFQTLRVGDDKRYPSNSPLYAYLSQDGFLKSIQYCPTHNVTLRVLPNEHETPRFPARIEGIVVHHTVCSAADCVSIFRNLEQQVSAHYLVTRDGNVICFGDPALRTHHAGEGSWRGRSDVNAWTLGIEIENGGYVQKDKKYLEEDLSKTVTRRGDEREWFPFSKEQEDTVRKMLQHFQEYYAIDPRNVIGHSDSAVGRKLDPGPLFPWKKFYKDFEIGAYHDHGDDCRLTLTNHCPDLKNVAWVQKNLKQYGYACEQSGELDESTRNAIKAFQMHFRPENISGYIDTGTIKSLESLVTKYCD